MAEEQKQPTAGAKKCFVVMGFGVKTDYATGRKLDLDKSYRLLIKPVVEEKGIVCVRADEIRHSGAIDVPMYEELLSADLVVADLSTANANALYELGIRHALRPWTTIVISENKLFTHKPSGSFATGTPAVVRGVRLLGATTVVNTELGFIPVALGDRVVDFLFLRVTRPG